MSMYTKAMPAQRQRFWDDKKRNRPPNEARIGLVVPPTFKKIVFAEAKKRHMPVQVLIRLAVEQYLSGTRK